MEIYNGDCFEQIANVKTKAQMVIVDLPYGQTACDWDVLIDLTKMWQMLDEYTTEPSVFAFFCTTKFGNSIINSQPHLFAYDLVWQKEGCVGWLNSHCQPMRAHEMIYVFKKKSTPITDRSHEKHKKPAYTRRRLNNFLG